MSASVWQPGAASIAVNAENASLIQAFTATAGQTTFALTQFTYVVGTGSIRVYRNGQKLPTADVNEIDSTHFSLPTTVLSEGELIECSAVLGSQDAVTAAAISAAASAAEAAASAASVVPANLVHIAGNETITGTKTFLALAAAFRNIANTFSGAFTNAITAARTWTLPDKSGTVLVSTAGEVVVEQVQLGSSGTAANNFVLQTNADGSGKLARGNVGATTQDIITWDAAGKVLAPQTVQTWQDVKASRAFATTYTNNTSLPIDVCVTATSSAAAYITATVAGVTMQSQSQGTAGYNINLCFKVPAAATYTMGASSAISSIVTWAELR